MTLPYGCTEDEIGAMSVELTRRIAGLPFEIRKPLVVRLYDDLARRSVDHNNVTTDRAREVSETELFDFHFHLLVALRAGDEDVIRRYAHGPFLSGS